jgi:hypothetical protein
MFDSSAPIQELIDDKKEAPDEPALLLERDWLG